MSEAMTATQYQASQIQKIPNYYIKWIWPNFIFASDSQKKSVQPQRTPKSLLLFDLHFHPQAQQDVFCHKSKMLKLQTECKSLPRPNHLQLQGWRRTCSIPHFPFGNMSLHFIII